MSSKPRGSGGPSLEQRRARMLETLERIADEQSARDRGAMAAVVAARAFLEHTSTSNVRELLLKLFDGDRERLRATLLSVLDSLDVAGPDRPTA